MSRLDGIETLEGVEGNWVREQPLSTSEWNKGFWRNVRHEEVTYKNGLWYNKGNGHTYNRPDDGDVKAVTTYWERFVPVVTVPTEPGVYTDHEGDAWTLDAEGVWLLYDGGYWHDVDKPEEFLPFTLVHSLKDR